MSTFPSSSMRDPLRPPALLPALARNWWLLLLRGIIAILFGVLAFALPGLTLVTLVLLYGAFALADGLIAIAVAIMGGGDASARWWLAAVGIAGVVFGILTFIWPGMTALVLLVFIATWAIVLGIFEIVGAIKLRKEIDNEWLMILNGALSILFGVVLLVWPGAGALALVWLIGLFAILFGIIYITLAFKLRQHRDAALTA
jgi:uncharacterized membrane protein HdeD (DUF308 family)